MGKGVAPGRRSGVAPTEPFAKSQRCRVRACKIESAARCIRNGNPTAPHAAHGRLETCQRREIFDGLGTCHGNAPCTLRATPSKTRLTR